MLTIQESIKLAFEESEERTPYKFAAEHEIGTDTMYKILNGGGARTDTLNEILEHLDLVVVPRSCVTKRKAIRMGYIREES